MYNDRAQNRKQSHDLCQVVRGCFGLGSPDRIVEVTSSADFVLHILARNVGDSEAGVAIETPPSQFRSTLSTGPHDGMGLDVPAYTGMSLGAIGARAGETLRFFVASPGMLVTVFLTVVTCHGANVSMTPTPQI